MRPIKIFFSADIHGSDVCFRKWVNAAASLRVDVIIFGGDLAGKILHPIIDMGNGRYRTDMYGQAIEAATSAELEALRARIRNAGRYDVVVTESEKRALDSSPDLVQERFLSAARETAERWIAIADERLRPAGVPAFMILGNDDFPELEDVFQQASWVVNSEGALVELPGGFEMISFGFSNPTPWDSPRELPEEELHKRIDEIASQLRDPEWSVFNFHVPPQGTALDQAATLDGEFKPTARGGQIVMSGVGSTAVRQLLHAYRPILSLHGHIHESPGMARLGRTTAINPGSEYVDGVLRGAIVTLDRKRGVRGWQIIQG